MGTLELIYDYKDIEAYRLGYNQLANQVFGLDIERWYDSGLWDDALICYSLADGPEIVANISVYKTDLIISGKRKKALQICSVMTRKDYRGRGLAKKLMDVILEKYDKEFDTIFLLGNKTVLDFYPKFGFKPLLQSKYELNVNIEKSGLDKIRKLDISNAGDLKLIKALVFNRRPISDVLGVENAQSIFMWQCYNNFGYRLYYLEDGDILAVCEQDGQKLHVYDIISKGEVNFNDLLCKIATEEAKKVIFHFTPDLLKVEADCSLLQVDDELFHDMFFVRGDFNDFSRNFHFPRTAQA